MLAQFLFYNGYYTYNNIIYQLKYNKMQKLTKQLFEVKANNKYPFPEFDYDYSKTEFQKSTDKIKIFCRKHNLEFESTSVSHFLAGRICPECKKELNKPKQKEKQLQKHNDFINRCKAKGLDKLYDLSKINYVNERTPIQTSCLRCGKELDPIYPFNFLNNNCGCNECKQKQRLLDEQTKFIEQAKQIHVDNNGNPKFDYRNVKYTKQENEVEIYCNYHKIYFNQTPLIHLKSKYCCPLCEKEFKPSNQLTTEQFISSAQKIHINNDGTPKYDYSITKCYGAQYYLDYICPIHGVKSQKAETHLQGHGCDECGIISGRLKQLKTPEQFIQEAKTIHDPIRDMLGLPRYDYSLVTNYNGAFQKVDIICPLHNKFSQTPNAHLSKQGCPYCDNSHTSLLEKEIVEFIKSIYSGTIIENDRTILKPKELDIYLPELKTEAHSNGLAIEFDGFYYHNGNVKPANFHSEKTENCEKQGIQLIHIFENEWLFKQEIVKSKLYKLLHKRKFRPLHIKSSNLIIKQVPIEEEHRFLETNHLQGYSPSQICYGIYWTPRCSNKEFLISIMSFGKPRFSKDTEYYELIRYCCAKYFTIYEGASALFQTFINKFNPKKIISYADRRWSIDSNNTLYNQLGFVLENKTNIGYWYIENKKLIHRLKYTKAECKKLGCPDDMTEKDFVTNILGLDIIYDAGQLVYVWSNTNQ